MHTRTRRRSKRQAAAVAESDAAAVENNAAEAAVDDQAPVAIAAAVAEEDEADAEANAGAGTGDEEEQERGDEEDEDEDEGNDDGQEAAIGSESALDAALEKENRRWENLTPEEQKEEIDAAEEAAREFDATDVLGISDLEAERRATEEATAAEAAAESETGVVTPLRNTSFAGLPIRTRRAPIQKPTGKGTPAAKATAPSRKKVEATKKKAAPSANDTSDSESLAHDSDEALASQEKKRPPYKKAAGASDFFNFGAADTFGRADSDAEENEDGKSATAAAMGETAAKEGGGGAAGKNNSGESLSPSEDEGRGPEPSPEALRMEQEAKAARDRLAAAKGESQHAKKKRNKETLDQLRLSGLEEAATAREIATAERVKRRQAEQALAAREAALAAAERKMKEREAALHNTKEKGKTTTLGVLDKNPSSSQAAAAAAGGKGKSQAGQVRFDSQAKTGSSDTVRPKARENVANKTGGAMGPIEATLRKHGHQFTETDRTHPVTNKYPIAMSGLENPWTRLTSFHRFGLRDAEWSAYREVLAVQITECSQPGTALGFVKWLDQNMPETPRARFVAWINGRMKNPPANYPAWTIGSAKLLYLHWDLEEALASCWIYTVHWETALKRYHKEHSKERTAEEAKASLINFHVTRFDILNELDEKHRKYVRENRAVGLYTPKIPGELVWLQPPPKGATVAELRALWDTQSQKFQHQIAEFMDNYSENATIPRTDVKWPERIKLPPYDLKSLGQWNPLDDTGVKITPPDDKARREALKRARANQDIHSDDEGALEGQALANEQVSINSDSSVATTLRVLLAAAGLDATTAGQFDNWLREIKKIDPKDTVVVAYKKDPKLYRSIARGAIRRIKEAERKARKSPKALEKFSRKLYHTDDSADIYIYDPESPENLARRARLEADGQKITDADMERICAPVPPPDKQIDALGRVRAWYTLLVESKKKGGKPTWDLIGDTKITVNGYTVWVQPFGRIQKRQGAKDPNLWLGHRISDLVRPRPDQRDLDNDLLDRICGENDDKISTDPSAHSSQSSGNDDSEGDDEDDESWVGEKEEIGPGDFFHVPIRCNTPRASMGGGKPKHTHLRYERSKQSKRAHSPRSHRPSAAAASSAAAAGGSGGGGGGRRPPDDNSSSSSSDSEHSDASQTSDEESRRKHKRRAKKRTKKDEEKGDGGRRDFDLLRNFPGQSGARRHRRRGSGGSGGGSGGDSPPSSGPSDDDMDGDDRTGRRIARIARHLQGGNNHVTFNIHGGGSRDHNKRISKKDFSVFEPQLERPEDHIKRLGQEMELAGVPPSKWVATLIITVPDTGDTRDRLAALTRQHGQSHEEHYQRVTRAFTKYFQQTEAQINANKNRFQNIVKSPGEGFTFQFKPRWEHGYRIAHPAHSGVNGEVAKFLEKEKRRMMIQALEPDIQAYIGQGRLSHSEKYSWEKWCNSVAALYENREPMAAKYSNATQENRIKLLGARPLIGDHPKLILGPASAQSLIEHTRSNGDKSYITPWMVDPFQTPKIKAEHSPIYGELYGQQQSGVAGQQRNNKRDRRGARRNDQEQQQEQQPQQQQQQQQHQQQAGQQRGVKQEGAGRPQGRQGGSSREQSREPANKKPRPPANYEPAAYRRGPPAGTYGGVNAITAQQGTVRNNGYGGAGTAGPCTGPRGQEDSGCGLAHDWKDCFRNPESKLHKPFMLGWKGLTPFAQRDDYKLGDEKKARPSSGGGQQ